MIEIIYRCDWCTRVIKQGKATIVLEVSGATIINPDLTDSFARHYCNKQCESRAREAHHQAQFERMRSEVNEQTYEPMGHR